MKGGETVGERHREIFSSSKKAVEEKIGEAIDETTALTVFENCIQKLAYIGKDIDYLPLLFKSELKTQYVASRLRIAVI